MTREELDFIGSMNMCDEISNEAYKKIVCHFEEQEPKTDKYEYHTDHTDCMWKEFENELINNTRIPIITGNELADKIIKEGIKKTVAKWELRLTQEPKTGHWISRWYKDKHFHVCSECQEEFSHDAETGIEITDYHICPNCEARMSEVSE